MEERTWYFVMADEYGGGWYEIIAQNIIIATEMMVGICDMEQINYSKVLDENEWLGSAGDEIRKNHKLRRVYRVCVMDIDNVNKSTPWHKLHRDHLNRYSNKRYHSKLFDEPQNRAVREWRQEHGLYLREAAEIFNYSLDYIGKIERGNCRVPDDMADLFANPEKLEERYLSWCRAQRP